MRFPSLSFPDIHARLWRRQIAQMLCCAYWRVDLAKYSQAQGRTWREYPRGNIDYAGLPDVRLRLEQQIPFSASLTFEQSCSEVDGDGASMAGMCAHPRWPMCRDQKHCDYRLRSISFTVARAAGAVAKQRN